VSVSRDVPTRQLHAANVSHEFDAPRVVTEQADDDKASLAPALLVTPKVEAALLESYAESAEVTVAEPESDEDAVEDSYRQPAIKARVPGVSDSNLLRYKRLMYRRDI
jgi:hypothetical protein